MTRHTQLNRWISDMAGMCSPAKIVWIDGSDEQRTALEKEALSTGEMIRLDPHKWPGCLYHRTAVNDVARTEDLTFICCRDQIDAGPTNNWMSPEEAYRRGREIFQGSMAGRTMYVIPFSMGPLGSPFSKIGIELTDSIYVVLNMLIMTRAGKKVLDQLGDDGEFTRGLHGKADLDLKRRLILHFPEDNTIWSVGSGYGGNVLLGKKCLSLRIASYLGKHEGWMAEHMLIMGLEDPRGNVDYVAAAFPSACGKTNLAMLVPPEQFTKKGYRIWTIGDDIAWLRVGSDGRLWAVNPEAGFFGVAPGTNCRSNPNIMKTIRKNTIFTNVLLTPEGDVWWENGEGPAPSSGEAWDGRKWRPGMKDASGKDIPGAHPNSRFTAPITQSPLFSPEWDNPRGVPLSAIVFGGRRSNLIPLVYEAFDWPHGVYMGATMSSEITAAQYGHQGQVRRDPMAMLPFCGYNMGHYFGHWLDMGRRLNRPPGIFYVNWFRKDEQGKFMWPGFGENFRVIKWIIDRVHRRAEAVETPLGYLPKMKDLELNGLDLPPATLEKMLKVIPEEWQAELESQQEFFAQFGSTLPPEIERQCSALAERLCVKNKL